MGGKIFFKWTEPQVTGTIIQDLINICVTEIPKKRKWVQGWKYIWRNNCWKLHKFDKRHKCTDSKNL